LFLECWEDFLCFFRVREEHHCQSKNRLLSIRACTRFEVSQLKRKNRKNKNKNKNERKNKRSKKVKVKKEKEEEK
jgi:hypothetical protein